MRFKKLSVLTLCLVLFASAVLFVAGGCSKGSESGGQPSTGGNLSDEESGQARDSFIVTFFSDGGTSVPAQTVKRGEKAVRPETPFKIENVNGVDVDYVFDGWFLGETEWDFEKTVITDDITLVARWHNEYGPPV